MWVEAIGVHPIEAHEPCHLIEFVFAEPPDGFDWGEVTQPVEGQPRANWQTPYDEQMVEDDPRRWVFFFHYLDPSRPLLVPGGKVLLPQSTEIPPRIAHIGYDPP